MSYWEDRQTSRYMDGEKLINLYYRDLEKAFIQAKKEIQQTIDMFYLRYADENGVTYAKARKLLSKAEIGELNDFIAKVKANMGKYSLEVENMSIKARITRYEALEKQIDAILQGLYAVDYEHNGSLTLGQVYKDSYYKTWYNIDQYTGFHKEFAQISPALIDTYINYPFDGANFSTRLWKQKTYLQQQLMESMTTMMIQGKHPSTLSKGFAKKFQTKQWEAYRLLHTEASFMMSQATHDAYKEDGVEKYEYIATLDSKTCEVCRPLDTKKFDVDKAVVGVNMAPMHPLCRCTDAPYYDDTPTDGMTRVAKDPETGESYKAPAEMSYKEWHAEYIENNPKKALAEKKLQHEKADREQFERYKDILGEDAPETLDSFQKLKYNDNEEWKSVQALYRKTNAYNKIILKEPAITADLKKISKDTGIPMMGLEYRLKAKDSFLRKVGTESEHSLDPQRIRDTITSTNDVIRYTYQDNPLNLVNSYKNITGALQEKGYDLVRVKNFWHNKGNPYNGINCTFRLPDPKGKGYQDFEVQFHTPESYGVKDRMHKDYEAWRLLNASSPEAIALRRKMMEQSRGMEIPANIEEVKNK